MDDDAMLAEVRKTFATLDRWRLIHASGLDPLPLSDLAADDEEWPYTPPTSLALVGLATAREHLHLVRISVEQRELSPAATATLCRTALIGAGLTVWMLAPNERTDRLRRMLSVSLDDHHRHEQYGADAQELLEPS